MTLPTWTSACISLSAANCPCNALISSFFCFSASSVATFFCAWHEDGRSVRADVWGSLRAQDTGHALFSCTVRVTKTRYVTRVQHKPRNHREEGFGQRRQSILMLLPTGRHQGTSQALTPGAWRSLCAVSPAHATPRALSVLPSGHCVDAGLRRSLTKGNLPWSQRLWGCRRF